MICLSCSADGKKSTVRVRMEGREKDDVVDVYFDEGGKRHDHDATVHLTQFACSNGHRWEVKHMNPCWCGWPAKEEDA